MNQRDKKYLGGAGKVLAPNIHVIWSHMFIDIICNQMPEHINIYHIMSLAGAKGIPITSVAVEPVQQIPLLHPPNSTPTPAPK